MPNKEPKEEKSYLTVECDKIGEIAVQYGFTVVKAPNITSDDISKTKPLREFDYYKDTDEKIALTRWYTDENLSAHAQPILICYKKPLAGSGVKKKSTEEMYGFEVIGSPRSTGEAILIRVALAIFSDLGHKDLMLDINSIGDKESIGKYERDLSVFLRKHIHEAPAKLRAEFKKNHYAILTNTSKENEEFGHTAPMPVGSLSDISRIHFKEVLEYIEMFDVPYKIKSSILSNKLFASHTVFEIRKDASKKDDGPLLAFGYRYNYLAKKIGQKKDIPSVGMTVIVKKTDVGKKILIKSIKKPRFYLVQLGSTAKLKALNVVETLRKQKISVYHSITKDKITGQLTGAEYMKATHVLIIGQKEAIENTVVVRNVVNREQETVPVAELVDFLKKLDKKA